jgi:predicted DNA binding CopG/RHH family protein
MKKKLTKTQQRDLAAIAALSDAQIDTSDIPEIKSLTGGIRGLFYRPVTQPVTIRLSAPDVAMARQLSKDKGLPYQTYIKMLLHEALQHHATSKPRSRRKSRSQ